MLIDFIKMQAQGNDFLILDQYDKEPLELDYPALAEAVCHPKFGFGADGLVILRRADSALAQMIIFNSDGSRAEMCGSALRCITSLLREKTDLESFDILTDSGIKAVSFVAWGSQAVPAVNLGIPVLLGTDLQIASFTGSLVDVGNLHFVIYGESLEDDPHLKWGHVIEHHPGFEQTVNVHFAQVRARDSIRIKIWENAVGATLACGTGAAASVCAGIASGALDDEVVVQMPGGEVRISKQKTNGDYLLIGPVETVGKGAFEWKI